MTDLILACLHHVIAFSMAAVLAFEVALTRPGIDAGDIRRLIVTDRHYGVMALLLLAIGFARAIWAAKGWDYYAANAMFWAKMATFLAIALLSAKPTLAIIGWRRASLADAGFSPGASDIQRVRRFLYVQAALFVLLPIFAAAMARGYGQF